MKLLRITEISPSVWVVLWIETKPEDAGPPAHGSAMVGTEKAALTYWSAPICIPEAEAQIFAEFQARTQEDEPA
jgi:hypothetical protein